MLIAFTVWHSDLSDGSCCDVGWSGSLCSQLRDDAQVPLALGMTGMDDMVCSAFCATHNIAEQDPIYPRDWRSEKAMKNRIKEIGNS